MNFRIKKYLSNHAIQIKTVVFDNCFAITTGFDGGVNVKFTVSKKLFHDEEKVSGRRVQHRREPKRRWAVDWKTPGLWFTNQIWASLYSL